MFLYSSRIRITYCPRHRVRRKDGQDAWLERCMAGWRVYVGGVEVALRSRWLEAVAVAQGRAVSL